MTELTRADIPIDRFPLSASSATLSLGPPGHVIVERYPQGGVLPSFVGPLVEWSQEHLRASLAPRFVMAMLVHVPDGLGEESFVVRAMGGGVSGIGFAEVAGLFATRRAADDWVARHAPGSDVLVVAVRRAAITSEGA